MRPLALKGHERPLTRIRYNKAGDLLFSAAKNKDPCVWYTENGERIGTYTGHNGAIWDLDVSWDTKNMVTASGDNSVKVWDCETGTTLHNLNTPTSARCIALSYSGNLMAYCTMKMMKNDASLCVYDIRDSNQLTGGTPVMQTSFKSSLYACLFTHLDERIVVGDESGAVMQYELADGGKEAVAENTTAHRFQINDMQLSPDQCFVITASRDKTAAMLNVETLEKVKQYKSERPVNSAAMSPCRDHIALGGGEDAMTVTQTAVSAGHFECKLYHAIFEDEFARFKGHFGPINTLAFHPTGTSIATGGEDGYIRLQDFDEEYLEFNYDC